MHLSMKETDNVLELIGSLPPFYEIAEYLWGKGVEIDSDGDSYDPKSTNWTELASILRSDKAQRIDIDPIEGRNDLMLKTTSKEL